MVWPGWEAIYASELQGLWSLLVAPLGFLAYRLAAPPDPARAVVPRAARFVSTLTLVFAIETMIDPIATGPLCRWPPIAGTAAASAIPFLFVLLGDLRVLLLAVGVAEADRGLRSQLARALALALVVPVATLAIWGPIAWIRPDLPGTLLWIVYEAGFLALAAVLGRVWVGRACVAHPAAAAYLRSVFGYSAAYYALWLTADLLILVGGLELGWAIRMVPNQLYYGFWVIFVYARFFGEPLAGAASPNAARQARSSHATQASR